jgi:hypothetical protein
MAMLPGYHRTGIPQDLAVATTGWTALTLPDIGWSDADLGGVGHLVIDVLPGNDGEEVALVYSPTDPGALLTTANVPLASAVKAYRNAADGVAQTLVSLPVSRWDVERGYWWVRASAAITVSAMILAVTEWGD